MGVARPTAVKAKLWTQRGTWGVLLTEKTHQGFSESSPRGMAGPHPRTITAAWVTVDAEAHVGRLEQRGYAELKLNLESYKFQNSL